MPRDGSPTPPHPLPPKRGRPRAGASSASAASAIVIEAENEAEMLNTIVVTTGGETTTGMAEIVAYGRGQRVKRPTLKRKRDQMQ